MAFSGILAVRDIRNCDGPPALVQQPLDVLPHALPLFERSRQERDMTDILEDASGGLLEFFSRRTLLTERVTQLVVFEDNSIRIEASVIRLFFPKAPGEGAWAFRFDTTHDLDLCSTAATLRAANDKHLAVTIPASWAFAPVPCLLVHEEH